MHADLRSIEHVFFEAMARGYVQNIHPTTLTELPGAKVIPFELGDYKVIDLYFTTPHSDKSSGQTIIFYRSTPVWTMHYGGGYSKIAIPFLKECLHRAYVKERRFYGGRGPHFVRNERFTYVNQVQSDSFAKFEGEEYVFDLSEQPLGDHWYRGMSLL